MLELLNDAGEKSSMRSAPGNGLGGGGLGGGGGGGGGPPFQQGNMAGSLVGSMVVDVCCVVLLGREFYMEKE